MNKLAAVLNLRVVVLCLDELRFANPFVVGALLVQPVVDLHELIRGWLFKLHSQKVTGHNQIIINFSNSEIEGGLPSDHHFEK